MKSPAENSKAFVKGPQRVSYELTREARVRFTVFLKHKVLRRPRWFVAGYPDLDIWSQASNRVQAERNAAQCLGEILTDAFRDGIFEKVMKQAGFREKHESFTEKPTVEPIPMNAILRAAIISSKLATSRENLRA